MTEEEIGKLAAEFVSKNISSLVEMCKGVLKGANREISLRLERTYREYIEDSASRYSKTKSFFIRNESVGLYDFYVPISIQSGKRVVVDPNYSEISSHSKRNVILGTGGCGKSVLMKHLFLSCLLDQSKIPVFIELRDLNAKKSGIKSLIYEVLKSSKFDFDEEFITKAIKNGHFAFILDGYDEVTTSLRKRLVSDIKKLSKQGKDCSITISSRPDEVFSGIDEFCVYNVSRLSLDNACTLVDKLPFDEQIKELFVKELKNGMYDRHVSFLSNPLLLSIMLLTFGQNAEIPTKLSIFYNQAYEALFQRHDALKGGYKRERATNLDIQDFAKIFSVFCLQSYDKRSFSFARTEALEYIDKTKCYLNKEFENEGFLEDALNATCLLMEDGLKIVFSHRSFQEYFVAYYIIHSQPEAQKKLIKRYWKNMRSDNVISLLLEMNQGLVERELFIPILTELYKGIGVKNKVGITHYSKFMKSTYSSFIFFNESISGRLKSNDADYSDVFHLAIN